MFLTRREALAGLSLSSLALFTKEAFAMSPASPQDPVGGAAGGAAPAYRGERSIVPLPFDPAKLNGISEKLIVSHHDNNYAAAVRNLNKVELALAEVSKETAPFVVAGLKERQLTFSNSATLHELYFANLGGDGKAAGEVVRALADAYGTAARWEEEFRATGSSLAGGSGWVILDLDLLSGALRIEWSGSHTQCRAAAAPLLVMDMYEHAYQMDYGAAAAKYIDAFFANVRWEEVDRRFERARKAAAALHA